MSAGSKEEFKAKMAEAAAGRPQHASFARMDSFATPTKSFGSTRGSGLDRPRSVPARVELRLQDRRSSRADLVHAPRSRAEQEQLEREQEMREDELAGRKIGAMTPGERAAALTIKSTSTVTGMELEEVVAMGERAYVDAKVAQTVSQFRQLLTTPRGRVALKSQQYLHEMTNETLDAQRRLLFEVRQRTRVRAKQMFQALVDRLRLESQQTRLERFICEDVEASVCSSSSSTPAAEAGERGPGAGVDEAVAAAVTPRLESSLAAASSDVFGARGASDTGGPSRGDADLDVSREDTGTGTETDDRHALARGLHSRGPSAQWSDISSDRGKSRPYFFAGGPQDGAHYDQNQQQQQRQPYQYQGHHHGHQQQPHHHHQREPSDLSLLRDGSSNPNNSGTDNPNDGYLSGAYASRGGQKQQNQPRPRQAKSSKYHNSHHQSHHHRSSTPSSGHNHRPDNQKTVRLHAGDGSQVERKGADTTVSDMSHPALDSADESTPPKDRSASPVPSSIPTTPGTVGEQQFEVCCVGGGGSGGGGGGGGRDGGGSGAGARGPEPTVARAVSSASCVFLRFPRGASLSLPCMHTFLLCRLTHPPFAPPAHLLPLLPPLSHTGGVRGRHPQHVAQH
jgi:hypothetical protein